MNILRNIEKRFFEKSMCHSMLEKILLNQAYLFDRIKNNDAEAANYSIFSQWNEDSIIQKIINLICIKNKVFVEIGVGDFFESNCRLLLQKDLWEGFIFEASKKYVKIIKNSDLFWKYKLHVENVYISRENINNLLEKIDVHKKIGLLSIDIDGNDFHVLKALNSFSFEIIICEYNSRLASDLPLTIPYSKKFYRNRSNEEIVYYGANLKAFVNFLRTKDYELICTNSHNSNAFFAKSEHSVYLKNKFLENLSSQIVFDESKPRSKVSRSNKKILQKISRKKLENTETKEIYEIGDLLKDGKFLL